MFLRAHDEHGTEWVMYSRLAKRMLAGDAAATAKKLISLGFAVTFKGDDKV